MTGRPAVFADARLRRLLRSQRRVVSRAQLREIGVRWEHVEHHLAAARWTALGPNVVALENGLLDVEQVRWAVVLAAGPRAALCAWTALQQHGLRGYEREEVHVVVPRGERPVGVGRRAGVRVVVHESRRHSAADVVVRAGPPSHSPARAAVDAAAWAPTDRAAAGVLLATVQQRLAVPGRLREELGVAGKVRRRALIGRLIADAQGGVEALSELDFATLCRSAGLQEPRRQRRRRDADGRWRWLDVEWVRRDGRRVVVEVDGRGHMREDVWEDDLLRANDVTIGDDAIVLRVAGLTVRTRPDRVVAQLRRVLA